MMGREFEGGGVNFTDNGHHGIPFIDRDIIGSHKVKHFTDSVWVFSVFFRFFFFCILAKGQFYSQVLNGNASTTRRSGPSP